jgi:hypothetical protein
MKRAALLASAAFAMVGGAALAQGTDDPMALLRACSLMAQPERMDCLDRLSRALTSAIPPASKENRWIISLTRSPVDFSPIATATLPSREDASGDAMQLSIRCRGGHTEIVVTGPALGRADDYAISYQINGAQPVQIAAGAPAFGTGVAFKGDAVTLIQSLPSEGEFALHLSPRVGPSQGASFSLTGLETVRTKLAAACKWPPTIARPQN